MTTTIDRVLDTVELSRAVDAGLVSHRRHAEFDNLRIFNYTPKAAYDGSWTPTTLACRGLIADWDTGEVLARPPAKFFNLGQAGAPELPGPHERVVAMDKMDGSLAIPYVAPDGSTRVATRGSFHSDQAEAATALWRERYDGWAWPGWATPYFEWVAPENRIVLDYGPMRDLVLLGLIDRRDGRHAHSRKAAADLGWPGPVAEVLAWSLDDALSLRPRANAEGLVLSWGHAEMLKLKQEDYLHLHRLRFSMTPRYLWERLSSGDSLEDVVSPLPDEFQGEARAVAGPILAEYGRVLDEIRDDYMSIPSDSPDRGKFAALAKQTRHPAAMFQIYDGRDIGDYAWRLARPKGD